MEISSVQINWGTFAVFGVTFLLFYFLLRRPKNLPPGPSSIPLLGSLGFFRKLSQALPYKVFAEAAKQYGGIMTVWVGPSPMIILNGYDAIHQAFVKQAADFNDRPNWITQFKYSLEYGKGVSFSNGEEWRLIRKFAVHSLRDFGVGKESIEHKIIEEAEILAQEIKERNSPVTNLTHLLQYAVSNVICSVVCGHRFDYTDKTFLELLRAIDIGINGQGGFVNVTNFLPKFMHPLFPTQYKIKLAREEAFQSTNAIISNIITEHEATFDPDNIRDFIDIYIKASKDDVEFSSNKYFNKGNIFKLIYDLFQAGSETTSTALDWAFLYMIEFPQVQEKCRQLIVYQCGHRSVRLADRPELPYVEATVMEVLRMQPVVPLGVPRTCATHDVVINGFTIPKRTVVMANLYSVNYDQKYWTAPLEFRPERFLDEEGKVIRKEAFGSMSYGPRNCLGDALGRNEMFLFFSNLLQRFEFKRKDENVRHDFSPKPDKIITISPVEYEMKIIPRV